MATVKLGATIRDSIIQVARQRFQAKVDAAKLARPEHHWGDIIYEKLFGEYKDVLNAVPQSFLTMYSEIHLQSVCDQKADLRFTLTDAVPFPSNWNSELARGHSYFYSLTMHDEWMPLHNEVVVWQSRIKQAETQMQEFLNNMRQVLAAYSTLAPALKAWPPLWDYVPEDIKERHRAIEKREKRKVEVAVDLDKLTAMATANKSGV